MVLSGTWPGSRRNVNYTAGNRVAAGGTVSCTAMGIKAGSAAQQHVCMGGRQAAHSVIASNTAAAALASHARAAHCQ